MSTRTTAHIHAPRKPGAWLGYRARFFAERPGRVTGTKCVKHRVSVCLSFCARWRGGGRRKGEGRCDVFAVRGAGRRGACDDTKALGCRFSLSLIRPT